MTNIKKKITLILAVVLVLSLACFVGCSKNNANKKKSTREADIGLPEKIACEIGEALVLPIPETTESVLSYTVKVKSGETDIAELTENDTAYTFDVAGSYTLVYNAETEREILIDELTCTVSGGGAFAVDWLPEKAGRFDMLTVAEVYKNINGQSVKAELKITSPSGKNIEPENGTVEFDEEGNWSFEFSAGSGSSEITETKTVSVSLNSSDLFSFTSGGVSKTDGVSVPSGMGARNNPLNAKGAQMTFKADSVIRFNNIVNLNELSSEDSLIELFAIPATVPDYTGYTEETLPGEKYPSGGYTHGTANFTRFEIRLTDIYDSNNVVVISFFYMPTYSYWNWAEGYINVGSKNAAYAINDGKFAAGEYGSNNVGTVGSYSFYGEGNLPFNVQIDYENKKFYSDIRGKGQVLVLDYSDSSKLGAANVWKGFATGECYMDIMFPSVTKESSVLITEVLGVSLAEDKPADSQAPNIYVDTSEFDGVTVPTAKVGAEYKIPAASAFDKIGGKCSVAAKVTDKDGREINVVNGKFTPSVEGSYNIVYAAKDFYGNEANKTITVEAKRSIEELTVTPASEYAFYAGVATLEPEFIVSGGSGKKQYAIGYYLNGKEIKATNGWLTFGETGTFEIKFEITDYSGTYEKILTYEVAATEKPVLDDVVLPYALYIGKEYQFPKVLAYDYKNDGFVDVDILVNGKLLGKDRKYTPSTSDGGLLTVTYSAAANGVLETKSYRLKVIDYSVTSHLTIEGDVSKEVFGRYTLISAEKDFNLSFAYPVSADGLKFSIGGESGKEKFASLEFTIKDAADAKKTLSFSLVKLSSQKFKVAIGSNEYSANFGWVNDNNANKESVSIVLNDGKIELKDENLVLLGSYPIEKWDNGTVFNGFTSGGAYFSMNVSGIYGATALKLFGFGNQTYAKSSSMSAPSISVLGEMKSGIVSKGDKISVPTAVGFSAISYDVSVTYEVVDPSGKTIRTGKGGDGGSFVCDKYGRYTCVYTAYDEVNGATAQLPFYFEAKDTNAPQVTIKDDLGTFKVGKSVTLEKASINDDSDSEKCVLKVFVVDTYYNSTDITSSMKYTPTKKGKYKVVYMAIDEAGNIGVAVSYFIAE